MIINLIFIFLPPKLKIMKMKKLLMVGSIFFLMASCNQAKVAYIDVDEILKEYEGAKEAEKEIQAESQKMSMEIEQMTMSFQAKVQEYQQTSSTLSADAKQQKEQELMQEQQQIQRGQQMVQQQMQVLSQAKIEELNKEIESFLEGYAESKGYSYILGTSQQTKAVMYGDATLNVTADVLDSLNENYESEDSEMESIEETIQAASEEEMEEKPE